MVSQRACEHQTAAPKASCRFRRTSVTEYWAERSLRFNAGCPNHLRPLFLVVYDELSEVGGRAGNHRAANIGKPRLHLGIGERCIDFLVELADDLGRRVPVREKTKPPACLVAR